MDACFGSLRTFDTYYFAFVSLSLFPLAKACTDRRAGMALSDMIVFLERSVVCRMPVLYDIGATGQTCLRRGKEIAIIFCTDAAEYTGQHTGMLGMAKSRFKFGSSLLYAISLLSFRNGFRDSHSWLMALVLVLT